jgi:CelD/BcsL family acetyltransferase involved in cellulose biosynthesis
VSQALRIELLREIPEDHHLQDGWNHLVHEMETAEVFYTYEWALSVHRAYAQSLTPLLALAWEGDRLLGVASLATSAQEQNQARFLAANTADYCDFLSHPADRSRFVGALLQKLSDQGIQTLILANLPADSATVPALSDASPALGYHRLQRHAYWCAQVRLDSVQDRVEISRGSIGRKTIRRCLNSLAKEGEVSLRNLRSWDDVSGALPAFSRAHVARFLATQRISNLSRPERRAFLQELSRQFSSSGTLTLSQLSVGEQFVAWNYGFQFAGSWFWYQPTFETRWEGDSPGLCLLAKILSQASRDSSINVVDLGLGAEGYKDRFATASRETLHVTLSGRIRDHLKHSLRYHLVETLNKSPRAEGLARKIRHQINQRRVQIAKAGLFNHTANLTKRLARHYFGQEQVWLYVWPSPGSAVSPGLRDDLLVPIDLDLLAAAAMQYFDDSETLNYLLRSVARLQSDRSHGFALLNESNLPVHFCWVTPFQDFEMAELKSSVSLPNADASVIYDCWTPRALRGKNLYATAIRRAAELLTAEGRVAWIFSAPENRPSVRGIEKAGFQRNGTLVQNQQFFVRTLQHQNAIVSPASVGLKAS